MFRILRACFLLSHRLIPGSPRERWVCSCLLFSKGRRGTYSIRGAAVCALLCLSAPEPVLYLPEESLPVKTPADRHDHLIRRVMQGMVMEHLPLP